MDAAICPGWPVPLGSVAWMAARAGHQARPQHTHGRRSKKAHPPRLTGTCSVLTSVSRWSPSLTSGPHRGKDTGLSSGAQGQDRALAFLPKTLPSSSVLPPPCLLKGLRELDGDPKVRPHPNHQDHQVGPSCTDGAGLTQPVSLEEKGEGGRRQEEEATVRQRHGLRGSSHEPGAPGV